MLLRNIVDALGKALGMWANPASWIAALLIVIGLVAKMRVSMLFWPEAGASGMLDTTLALMAGMLVYLVFLGSAVVAISRLTAAETALAPLWGRAVGILLMAIAAGTAFVIALSGAVGALNLPPQWLMVISHLGDLLIVPGYILTFASLDGQGGASLGRVLRSLPALLAAALLMIAGALAQQAMPQPALGYGLLPMLPAYATSAVATVSVMLLACTTSRRLFRREEPLAVFR
jgi:hypothetical protein